MTSVNNIKKSYHLITWGIIAFLTCCVLTADNVRAAGTPAGTTISNTVTVNYQMGGGPQPALSGSTDFAVDGVISLMVTLNKTVTVIDQWGGHQPLPGATLRYTITATASGMANNVVVVDPLPKDTAFIPNTLKLNNAALTDAADTDAGDVGGTTANMVTVKLGNLTSVSLPQKITFDVKIK